MLRLATAALLLAGLPAWGADYTITAPAAPGGGWDQTARAMQGALLEEGIAQEVEVVNVPGAGGTVGLARFAREAKGDPEQLLVGGAVMVGAIIANHSPIDLGAVTPIARLTSEQEAIVVPAASPIRSMADITVMLKADPRWVVWGGGSAGGTDHILAAKIAKAVGVDPTQIDYAAHSGGGEVVAALRANEVMVGVSGLAEFESEIAAGKLRLLAIAGERRAEGVEAPTLREAGIDVVLENWRMVAAAPGLDSAEAAAIGADIERLAGSDAWKRALAEHGWSDRYLTGEAFGKQLAAEVKATRAILAELGLLAPNPAD